MITIDSETQLEVGVRFKTQSGDVVHDMPDAVGFAVCRLHLPTNTRHDFYVFVANSARPFRLAEHDLLKLLNNWNRTIDWKYWY